MTDLVAPAVETETHEAAAKQSTWISLLASALTAHRSSLYNNNNSNSSNTKRKKVIIIILIIIIIIMMSIYDSPYLSSVYQP